MLVSVTRAAPFHRLPADAMPVSAFLVVMLSLSVCLPACLCLPLLQSTCFSLMIRKVLDRGGLLAARLSTAVAAGCDHSNVRDDAG